MKKFLGVILIGLFALMGFAQTTSITIVASTDSHGYITSYDYVNDKDLDYGLPYAAYLLKNIRKEHKNVILVDCGDTLSGTALTYFHAYYKSDKPNPVIKVMNELKYDIAVLGNHDFDFGQQYLVDAINQAKFPWISANLYQNNFPFTYIYKIIEKGGVKVGFFGLTTPATKYFEPPKNVKDIIFKQMAESAKKAVQSLKKEGADVIVALVHSGKGPMYAIKEPYENALYYVLENVKGIDIAIYGHTHKENPIEIYNNVLICQPKNYFQSLGVIMIDLQKRDGHWEILNKASTTLHVNGKMVKSIDKEVKYITSDLKDFLNQKIGVYKDPIEFSEDYNNPGTGFDLLYKVEKSAFGDADVYMLTLPYKGVVKEKGEALRIRHAFKLLPYDNYLVKCNIKGANLLKMLEKGADLFDATGKLKPDAKPYFCDIARNIDYSVDFTKPEGSRVVIKKVNGRDFDVNAVYSVVLTTYRYAENLDFIEKGGEQYSNESFRTLAIKYLKSQFGKKESDSKEEKGFFNW
ncbi:2',3'-cyclic-nucleotide 2'-phosphodiesterase [Thermotomaculum hydrothermale]|uniref:2',3'-cyclic-nucleotide 2'-phosphodiesterase n=1 Tax=Thermotomaculum hydrothermale TaxID=981385 RepID=A0A7R6Q0Z0_9BACT|nr:metallophosphoesterase [Thermotomaculum hydrothermale]BBB33598.1 2',3'-cyclic-nucleotide 2'-phosphodiesterase [Thermotomaculum hydrothermale]